MINQRDLETQLSFVCAQTADPRMGVFGPASVTWAVDREAAIFLGAGRAILLQLSHPWVATAIAQHSRVLDDPIGRFHRTFRVTFTMVFGTLDQALTMARRLHSRHATITGVMPRAAGPFPAGSPYCANDPDSLRWVYATLIETALMAYGLVLPPLAREDRARYYAESRTRVGLYGIEQANLPESWEGFAAYAEAMCDSDTLTVTPEARAIAAQILKGGNSFLRIPRWYQAVTAGMLPPRLRAAFELPYGDAEQRLAQSALQWIRRVYPALPKRLRFVGPYQEAVARLSGNLEPDLFNRWLNRIWIGQPAMNQIRREVFSKDA